MSNYTLTFEWSSIVNNVFFWQQYSYKLLELKKEKHDSAQILGDM